MARRQSSTPGRCGGERIAAELRQLREILQGRGHDSHDSFAAGRSPELGKSAEPVKSPVTVICRFRGQSAAEKGKGGFDAWELDCDSVMGKAGGSSLTAPCFSFDHVLGPPTSQAEVYQTVKPLIEEFLAGVNCAILCYGQTSAGKTFTMAGPKDAFPGPASGLVPRMLADVFEASTVKYKFRFSMLEIHQERLRDLLNPDANTRLRILEDRSGEVAVQGLRELPANSYAEAVSIFWKGSQRRTTSATGMNDASSRSHSILIVIAEKGIGVPSKFYFVDLAGSESVKKTALGTDQPAPGNTELSEETKCINQSLSTLGLVLARLVEKRKGPGALDRHRSRSSLSSVGNGSVGSGSVGSSQETHVPYRSSKLTRVLQDVLSGNMRTSLVINCSISSLNAAETISTLRFGQRARSLITHIKGNELDEAEKMSELANTLCAARQEILRLRGHVSEFSCPVDADNPLGPELDDDTSSDNAAFTPRSNSSTPRSCRRHPVDTFTLDDACSLDGCHQETPTSQSANSRPSFRLGLSGSTPTTTWMELTPRQAGDGVHPKPRHLNFEPISSSASRSIAPRKVSSPLVFPIVPASHPVSLLGALNLETKPLSWEHPLTRKECCLRMMLAQQQRSDDTVARLSRAEAELEWLQYLTPGSEEPITVETTDTEEDLVAETLAPVTEEDGEFECAPVRIPRAVVDTCAIAEVPICGVATKGQAVPCCAGTEVAITQKGAQASCDMANGACGFSSQSVHESSSVPEACMDEQHATAKCSRLIGSLEDAVQSRVIQDEALELSPEDQPRHDIYDLTMPGHSSSIITKPTFLRASLIWTACFLALACALASNAVRVDGWIFRQSGETP